MDRCREAYDEGDLRWAAELLNHVLFARPDHAEARELQARTFTRLGHAQENGTWRNIYLTGALELRRPDGTPAGPGRSKPTLGMLAALDTEQVFQTLATRLNGPRAVAHRLLLRWEFTDSSETWTTLVGNGVLTPLPDDVPGDEPPQAAVCLPRTALDRAVAGVTGLADAIASGEVSVAGDADALSTLLDLFDEVSADFAIVLP